MKKFVSQVERCLIRAVVLTFVALVVVQGLMTRDDYRLYLSIGEKLEGQKLEQPVIKDEETAAANRQENASQQADPVQSPQAFAVISMDKFSSLPRAFVLVNNRKAADFSGKEVRLNLTAGDVIEIDATYYNFPIKFIIRDASDNLANPHKSQTYQANQGIVMVGKVIVK